MALDPVIFRTPILDASGKLTREWIRFFQELQAATGTVQNVQNTTVMQGQASAFDDVPTRDITAEIINALLASVGEPSGKAPADESVVDWTPSAPACTDPLAAFALDSADPLGSAAAVQASLATVATTGSYTDLSNKPTIPAAQVAANLANSTSTGVTGILPIANGGTGQITAAAALSALGGASLTGTNTFSGANSFSTVQVSMRWGALVGSGTSGTALAGEFVGGSSPVSARLQFGTDGSGWQLRIAKNQGGTVTDFMTFVDSGAISTAATTSFTAGGSFCTHIRTVTAADTATTTDRTIILNGTSLTETLPASPLTGQELYFVNIAATAATIGGNGKNIWTAGTTAASISLAANSTAILQYDGILWRQVK